ncbi:MAG: hypothetical protein HY052_02505 [Proteobacteria bacterium]|nr:hypothetical protein [Pseudomonadota bacterium]
MPSQKGRDLLLKIGNGASPETFATIGAARTVAITINNHPVNSTTLDSNGFQCLEAAAGLQALEIILEGLFKDTAAEETLRQSAFGRTTKNYQLLFPNGDVLAAAFVIGDYRRSGSFDGLEGFALTLVRSGNGTFTPGG